MSLDKLTQSTHAHLLSFAVLFSLTGLVFAFTSYPTTVRCVVAPLVLLAIVTDVAFWWLARLSDGYGVYFAKGVIGTGMVVGVGLALQITLSLWNMYGPKGKVVILLLFALGAAAGGLVFLTVAQPGLEEKRRQLEQARAEAVKPAGAEKPVDKQPALPVPVVKQPDPGVAPKTPEPKTAGPSRLEMVLQFPLKGDDGKDLPVERMPFDKDGKKNMVRAFFDKDGGPFNKLPPAAKAAEIPKRFGELEALTAWARLADAERRKAFEADALTLPSELARKPITEDYVKNGKVLIKTLIADRCARCHADEENAPFDEKDYESLRQYFEPAQK